MRAALALKQQILAGILCVRAFSHQPLLAAHRFSK
jgi:hypothetical protein